MKSSESKGGGRSATNGRAGIDVGWGKANGHVPCPRFSDRVPRRGTKRASEGEEKRAVEGCNRASETAKATHQVPLAVMNRRIGKRR